ncbi:MULTISPECIES: YmaF family protein [Paenibacillus]|uniref:YmaF family protein n=1 Tax=Paenibacillus TaxID=44249 RepID=UPI0022B8ABF9|nr:YmaF family protein [Paenibacillus caseinilyticus]MCZ8519961.1 YmaF family protein [Paenibacillus caseinilyticus]
MTMQSGAELRLPEPEGPSHAHAFWLQSSAELGHSHLMLVYTYAVNGTGQDGHIHTFQGHTRLAARHFHRMIGRTGPPIALPDGTHYHEVHGELDDEPFRPEPGYYTTVLSIPRHIHLYAGRSGPPIGVEPPGW